MSKINIIEKQYNVAGVIPTLTNSVGATVIRSEKGVINPVFFGGGDTTRLHSYYGDPSAKYPELGEVRIVVSQYPCVVQRAMSDRYTLSALVLDVNSNGGFKELAGGLDVSIDNLGGVVATAVPFKAVFTAINATEFELDISGTEDLNTVAKGDIFTIGLLAHGSTETTEVAVLRDAELGNVSDTVFTDFDITTASRLKVTIASDAVSAGTPEVYIQYTRDLSAYKYLIVNKIVSDEQYQLTATVDDNDLINVKIVDDESTVVYNDEISLGKTKTDSFGVSLWIEDKFRDNEYFALIELGDVVSSDRQVFLNTVRSYGSTFDFSRGTNGGVVTLADVVKGYERLRDRWTSDVDVVFDGIGAKTAGDEAILTGGIQSACRAAKAFKYADIMLSVGLHVPVADITQSSGQYAPGAVGRNISYYYSWGYVRDVITGKEFLTNLMGDIALGRLAIHDRSMGSEVHAMVNENGMGGQLTSGRIVRLYYPEVSRDNEVGDLFEKRRVNLVFQSGSFGYMIYSSRTTVEKNDIFTYVERSSVANKIIRFVAGQVLPLYVEKKVTTPRRVALYNSIDGFMRNLVDENYIEDYRINTSNSVNTEEVLARNEYIVDVGVRYKAVMKVITLRFTSASYNASLDELIGSGAV